RLQRCVNVHRPFYRVSGRPDGTPENSILCGDVVYADLRVPSTHSQLQLVHRGARFGRADLGNVLPAYAHLCATKYSSSIPSLHHSSLRDVRRWSREHRPIALWLVQRPSLLAMDVLEL